MAWRGMQAAGRRQHDAVDVELSLGGQQLPTATRSRGRSVLATAAFKAVPGLVSHTATSSARSACFLMASMWFWAMRPQPISAKRTRRPVTGGRELLHEVHLWSLIGSWADIVGRSPPETGQPGKRRVGGQGVAAPAQRPAATTAQQLTMASTNQSTVLRLPRRPGVQPQQQRRQHERQHGHRGAARELAPQALPSRWAGICP